jgi:hypothetical protein
MQIIGVGQRTSECRTQIEGPAVTYIVEVRYSGSDWADLLADMRSWLDRRQIEAEEFSPSVLGRIMTVRVGFRDEDDAAAFASAFSGRLLSSDPHRATAGTTTSPADNDAGSSFAKFSALSDDLPLENVQPAVKTPSAGFSLMITRQQKADLRERGYSDGQIRDMKPEEAHRVLGLIEQQPPSTSAGRRRSPR